MFKLSKSVLSGFVFAHRHAMVAVLALLSLTMVWWGVDVVPDFPFEQSRFFVLACVFLGTFLLLAGIALRIWSGLYIGGNKNSSLVVAGPYRLIRNPLYVGNLVSAMGVLCFTESATATLLLITGLAFVYRFTIVHEEMNLLSIFGETYREYSASTPRFVPHATEIKALLKPDIQRPEQITYTNLARELGRGSVFITTGILVLILTQAFV